MEEKEGGEVEEGRRRCWRRILCRMDGKRLSGATERVSARVRARVHAAERHNLLHAIAGRAHGCDGLVPVLDCL